MAQGPLQELDCRFDGYDANDGYGYTSRLGWTQVQPFSFIPSDLSHAPFKAHGAASGAVGGDAVALTVPVAPHRPS